jgi:hypothetical protein
VSFIEDSNKSVNIFDKLKKIPNTTQFESNIIDLDNLINLQLTQPTQLKQTKPTKYDIQLTNPLPEVKQEIINRDKITSDISKQTNTNFITNEAFITQLNEMNVKINNLTELIHNVLEIIKENKSYE